jgi:pimeloyl-ACP methyl ester carboxylesterase
MLLGLNAERALSVREGLGMARGMRWLAEIAIVLAVNLAAMAGPASAAGAKLKVTWMPGFHAAQTPGRYNKVGVIKVGSPKARNVLVLEPGTSAGSAYFVPLAQWIVSRDKRWQVWSVERRENLLENQTVLDQAKRGQISATQLFNYYLGYLTNPSIANHNDPVADSTVEFAKQWGMKVAVNDLHDVIQSAGRLGGKVVLGGHSLGGSVVTAYATWNFGGKPGAASLAGLVYDDGGSFAKAESAAQASSALASLDKPSTTPWLAFGGVPAPDLGLFSATGSTAALIDPNGLSAGQASGLLTPFGLAPPVPVTNLAQYGYAQNVGTSPPALIAAQAHLGTGLDATGNPRGWDGAGALTPINRFADMFSGRDVSNADGTEWYFPARLTLDTAAVGNGTGGAAQKVVGLKSTLGRHLPRSLRIYGFGAALGGQVILDAAKQLARQSHIPASHLTLINRHSTYAHNDPAGAYPHNVFFSHLVSFLNTVAT